MTQLYPKVAMTETSISKGFLISHPAVYRIRVLGRMDPKWSGYLQGMTVSVFEAKEQEVFTELLGRLADQAALMGVLQLLYNRNIPLFSVECVSARIEKANSSLSFCRAFQSRATKNPSKKQQKSVKKRRTKNGLT